MKAVWIIQALSATSLYAVAALLDRYMLHARAVPAFYYFLIGNLAGLIVAFVCLIAAGGQIEFDKTALLGVCAGVCFGVFTYLYLRTIAKTSPVATAAFMQAVPVLSTFGSPAFLSEPVSITSVSAILLLCLGLSFISMTDKRAVHVAAPQMLPAVVILTAGYLIQKKLLESSPIVTVLALNRIGNLFVSGALFLLYWLKGKTPTPLGPNDRPILVGAALAGELLSVGGLLLSLFAYQSGTFADVSALLATLPVFVLLGAIVMNRLQAAPVWTLP